MKITNNTSYNITLVNGMLIKKYATIYLMSIDEDLTKQLANLQKNGSIRIEN